MRSAALLYSVGDSAISSAETDSARNPSGVDRSFHSVSIIRAAPVRMTTVMAI
jgi:hypothetical protein